MPIGAVSITMCSQVPEGGKKYERKRGTSFVIGEEERERKREREKERGREKEGPVLC